MVRRRILAVPLALVVAIAVFISPVFAFTPTNTAVGTFDMYFTGIGYEDGLEYTSANFPVDYGTLKMEKVHFTKGGIDGNASQIKDTIKNITWNMKFFSSENTVYVAVRNASYTSGSIVMSPDLESKHVQSNDVIESYTRSFREVWYLVDGTTQSYSSYSDTFTVRYLCFEDVNPFGDYWIRDTKQDSSSPIYFTYLVFGVWIDAGKGFSNIGDDYINGDSSLSETLDSIYTELDNLVNNAQSAEEVQFITAIAQNQINRVIQASNDKNLSAVQNTFVPATNSIITSFSTGNISLPQALTSLESSFSSALDAAETPEQGILVNTTHQIALKKLELEARLRTYDRLDSAISDDQLTEADDYYSAEEDLIDQFELAEFESALDFELWFNTLPPSETSLYKQFFDYLLNESSLRMFLIVPISLILVRILMGTHLVLGRGGGHSSKTTVFDSDDHYRFYDDGFRGS